MVNLQSWIHLNNVDAIERLRPPIVKQAERHSGLASSRVRARTHEQETESVSEDLAKPLRLDFREAPQAALLAYAKVFSHAFNYLLKQMRRGRGVGYRLRDVSLQFVFWKEKTVRHAVANSFFDR